MLKLIKYSFFVIILLYPTIGCKKSNNVIPYVDVYISININNPAYFKLTSVGGWTYLSGGSKGIIAFRKDQDTFMAYDRHSTYNVDDGCILAVDSSNVFAEDPCSGSQFLLNDGSVLNGPATFPMQQYKTSFDGQVLQIYN